MALLRFEFEALIFIYVLDTREKRLWRSLNVSFSGADSLDFLTLVSVNEQILHIAINIWNVVTGYKQ